jgi:cell division protein ZapD
MCAGVKVLDPVCDATSPVGQYFALDRLVEPVTETIIYEQPLNERVRIFLRLEFLFAQAAHHLRGGSAWDSRSTLNSILEILNIFGRTDLKTEVLKELERHCTTLGKLQINPDIDKARLGNVLKELESLSSRLHKATGGPVAADLRKNEFLSSIQQRSAIPGGTCDFDLPAYHFWLKRPASDRAGDLAGWLSRFEVIAQAIQLILRVIRDSAELRTVTAQHGFYQKSLDANHPCQLVRVAVSEEVPYYAEISGGRHRFTVRFLESSLQDGHMRQATGDVGFKLGCCAI